MYECRPTTWLSGLNSSYQLFIHAKDVPCLGYNKAVLPFGFFSHYSETSALERCVTGAHGEEKNSLHPLADGRLKDWKLVRRQPRKAWRWENICAFGTRKMLKQRDLGLFAIIKSRQAELFQRAKHLQEQSRFLIAETVNEPVINSDCRGQISCCYLMKAKFTLWSP